MIDVQELPYDKEGYTLIQTKVSDTGIGMSEEFLPSLFELFTRERNTTLSKIPGTGLGMAIVKNLVDLMNGSIEVESELGKGSTLRLPFHIRLRIKIILIEILNILMSLILILKAKEFYWPKIMH